MITRTHLNAYLADLLQIALLKDYCPNGLQVEGKLDINTIVTGVTACQALLDAAVAANADAILVHHGYFWKGEKDVIHGMKKQRLATLLQHDINLFAYHLPLDVHAEFGNNVQLAQRLQLNIHAKHDIDGIKNLLYSGELAQAQSGARLGAHISKELQREPLHIAGKSSVIKRIAWCTGAAQGMVETAANLGVDAYLTGEVAEQTYHAAREYGLHFFACGHHATERYGIAALGNHLASKFAIAHQFIDIDNPI